MDWYTPSSTHNLPEGARIEPPYPYGELLIANSHKMAVAVWRYTPERLTYYRVQVYDEPIPAEDGLPGLFRCLAAKVIGRVHDGSGYIYEEGYPRGPRWSDEELWPFVKMAQWPNGEPMYDEQAHITDPPGVPSHEFAQRLVRDLRKQQYSLPGFVKHHLDAIRNGPFGNGWPPLPWTPPGDG
ncbi:hypothetical protein JF781_20550 [Mycobacterium sp. WUMAC-067]|uniref:hypothetical protein n=1 Tax=unclassified Mycobacterium TaxID=2642494 RepID=UPI001CD976A9|nr:MULTISPECIES: hypothetical protein [unclassified Mycobacterium]MCA2244754.1 hypothetical protein [Mycobacterium sp. WUMAC-067]MCA2316342.1 hypothetical protein [Mycobacterium sp. WUMAC-025]